MTKRCWVYWIHLPEHTDLFSEGYVGITTIGVKERFKRHKTAALVSKVNAKRSQRINHCINKYGDSLVVDTLLLADQDYCFEMEAKLRPSTNIGWNLARGGRGPAAGRKNSPEHIRKVAEANRGLKRTAEQNAANSMRLISYQALLPDWQRGRANKVVWLQAPIIYAWHVSTRLVGRRSASKALGLPPDALILPLKRIKAGWVPSEDSEYMAWKQANEREAIDA